MAGKRKLLRGHYNPTGKVRKYLNLQTARDIQGRKLLICTKCLKAGKHLKNAQ